MHHALFIAVCCIWGTSFILMKRALTVYSPIDVGAVRCAAGALALGIIWHRLRRPWPLSRRDLPILILITLIGYAVPFVVQPYVIGVIESHSAHGSSFAGMMVSLVPLMTVIASAVILKTYPSVRQLVGVVGALAMMMYLFRDELSAGVRPTDLALACATPIGYAIANTLIKKRFEDVPASALVLCTLTCGAVLLTPIAVVVPDAPPEAGASTPVAAAALLVLGVVCTGGATYLFYKLIQREGPLFAGMVAYIIPTVAMLLGLADGERISTAQVVALAGVFAMVALAQAGGAPAAQRRSGLSR